MRLFLLGFPAVVFGMEAAHEKRKQSGAMVLLAAALYVAESVLLCLILGWREDPQMLISTPLLTILFLRFIQSSGLTADWANPMLCRTVSSGMYNIHPLLLAGFALVLPGLDGLWAFMLCAALSAFAGWALYRLRKNRFFALFL